MGNKEIDFIWKEKLRIDRNRKFNLWLSSMIEERKVSFWGINKIGGMSRYMSILYD